LPRNPDYAERMRMPTGGKNSLRIGVEVALRDRQDTSSGIQRRHESGAGESRRGAKFRAKRRYPKNVISQSRVVRRDSNESKARCNSGRIRSPGFRGRRSGRRFFYLGAATRSSFGAVPRESVRRYRSRGPQLRWRVPAAAFVAKTEPAIWLPAQLQSHPHVPTNGLGLPEV
jgi:hypothetical protein